MAALVSILVLSAALGALLLALPPARAPGRPASRRAMDWAALALFSAYFLSFAWPPSPPSGRLAAEPSWPQLLDALLGCAAAGTAAMTLAGGRRAWLAGAACGAIFGALAHYARLWLALACALKLAGDFSGGALCATMPWLLAAAGAAAAAALAHPEMRPVRGRLLAGLLAAVIIPAYAVRWRLGADWDYGPRSLLEAAGVPRATRAGEFSIAWLRPFEGRPYRLEPLDESEAGIDASFDSLQRLYRYLETRRGRTLFAAQALSALRGGWLKWWDADRALEAAALSFPGRSHPDYLESLALLRAGPLTPQRYARLRALDDESARSTAGFEDVNQSQLIFEAFSAAYARFGDDDDARRWIYRVDNLWPIYDKKVEVTPVENFRAGRIEGSVFEGGRPAAGVRVGLFFLCPSSAAISQDGTLSQSVFPDGAGRFEFSDLGAGRYYVALMARAERLKGRILGAPGIFELSPEVPEAALEPIRIEP